MRVNWNSIRPRLGPRVSEDGAHPSAGTRARPRQDCVQDGRNHSQRYPYRTLPNLPLSPRQITDPPGADPPGARRAVRIRRVRATRPAAARAHPFARVAHLRPIHVRRCALTSERARPPLSLCGCPFPRLPFIPLIVFVWTLARERPHAARELLARLPSDLVSTLAHGFEHESAAEQELREALLKEYVDYASFFSCLEMHSRWAEIWARRPRSGSVSTACGGLGSSADEPVSVERASWSRPTTAMGSR